MLQVLLTNNRYWPATSTVNANATSTVDAGAIVTAQAFNTTFTSPTGKVAMTTFENSANRK